MQGTCSTSLFSNGEIYPLNYTITSPKDILLSEAVDKLVIGTYNVLFPQKFGQDKSVFSSTVGYNVTADCAVIPNETWRLQLKIKNILNIRPDALSLQEVTQEEFDEYQKRLKGYKGIFCLHPNSFHGVSVFYKSDQFNLIGAKAGKFQFQSGTVYKTSLKGRVHLVADIQDKMSGLILRMVSCHLFDPRDWDGIMKSRHVETIVDHALGHASYGVDVVAVCGDMNQDQFGDDVTTYLKENPEPVSLEQISAFKPFLNKFFHDKNLTSTEYDKDLTKVDGDMLPKNRKTDWNFIKTKNDIQVERLKGVILPEYDPRGSDHVMTLTKIKLKRTFF